MAILTKDGVFIDEWLRLKPYKVHSNYDSYYLKIANKVYRTIQSFPEFWNDYEIIIEQKKIIACMLTSYFEDFISEIGIWRAFTQTNQKLYGYEIPFYELTDYDADYINQLDIQYLIWHYLSDADNTLILSPKHPTIIKLSELIFDIFEVAIDDSPATDFYKKYLKIDKNTDFFALKFKLSWFAFRSYLLTNEFYIDYQIQVNEMYAKKQPIKPSEVEYLKLQSYDKQNLYFYQKKSKFSALTCPEWFSMIIDANDSIKAEIVDFKFHHSGLFVFEGSEGIYDVFSHTLTKEKYLVRKDSFNKNSLTNVIGTVFLMDIYKFHNEWHLSGSMMGGVDVINDEMVKQYHKSQTDTPWISPYLDKSREAVREQEIDFIEFFGSKLVLLKNQIELNQAFNDFIDFQKQKKNKHSAIGNDLLEKYKINKTENEKNLSTYFSNDNDLAIFFISKIGMITFSGAKNLISLLESESILSKEEKQHLFEDLTQKNHLAIDYFLENYPTHQVQNILIFDMNLSKDLKFLQRFNNPEEFGEKFPAILMIPN